MPTDRSISRAGLWACLTLTLGLSGLASLASAQQSQITPAQYSEHIRETVLGLQQRYIDGDRREAIAALRAFDAEVDQYEDFMDGHRAFHWPDLVLARLLYHNRSDDHEVVRITAPIVQRLDREGDRAGSTRLEAQYLQARALYRLKNYADAEAVLRHWHSVAAGAEGLDETWWTQMDFMLSRVATLREAPDAARIRARVLPGFIEREGATPGMFRLLQDDDLETRRQNPDRDRRMMILRAREFEAWLNTQNPTFGVSSSLNLVARIYSEGGEHDRAHDLLEGHRDTMFALRGYTAPYFWAIQNILENQRLRGETEAAIDGVRAFFDVEAPDRVPDRATADALSEMRWVEFRALQAEGRFYEAQSALLQAYELARRYRSANDTEVNRLRRSILPQLIPASYPFQDEIITWDKAQVPFELTVDGASVLGGILAGDYTLVSDQLRTLSDAEGQSDILLVLNLAYFHGMLGNLDVLDEAVATGRVLLRRTQQTDLPANTHLFDMAEAMGKIFSRQAQNRAGRDALVRLENRRDLSPQQRAIVHALRVLYESRESNPARARRHWETHEDAILASVDMTIPGVLLGLLAIDQGLIYGDIDKVMAFQRQFRADVRAHGGYALADVVIDLFTINSTAGAADIEENFQTLGAHIGTLSRMLPDDHQWNVVARVNYAFALQARAQYGESAALFEKTIQSYRQSRSHRTDVVGFLEVNRAWSMWFGGQADLAQSIIDQVHTSVDPLSWDPDYVYDVVHKQAISLDAQGRQARALDVLDQLLYRNAAAVRRLEAQSLSSLWIQRGIMAERLDRISEAREAYENAIAALPSDDFLNGWPMAQALYNRSQWFGNRSDHLNAYRDMAKSNDLWFGFYEQSRADKTVRNTATDKSRVIEQAIMGWRLAGQLDPQAVAE